MHDSTVYPCVDAHDSQMYTLWTVRVDGGNGKELYGDAYADIFAINRLHYKAWSPVECDHVSRSCIRWQEASKVELTQLASQLL